MSNEEQVIAVMGLIGVGKSSFIYDSVPPALRTEGKFGGGLRSGMKEIQPFGWVTEDGTKVKLVDTPGYDESGAGLNGKVILEMIMNFLTKEDQGKNSRLTGLVYVHRIIDTREGDIALRNLQMFQQMCGDGSLKNVVIVTTMWDKIDPDQGSRREQELMSNVFKPFLDKGAVMRRHDRTPESAAIIIKRLLGTRPTTTKTVEIIQEKTALEDTPADTDLYSEILVHLQKHKEEIGWLEAEVKEMSKNVEDISGKQHLQTDTGNAGKELVIAIMGPTGVGKTSFINQSILPSFGTDTEVEHDCGFETSPVELDSWVKEDGTRVKLVNTPSFGDPRGVTDAEVLQIIATFLENEYNWKMSHLTGLIYVHGIGDKRREGIAQGNLRMLQKLCGGDSLRNVVIVTTMWDEVTPEEGKRCEQVLKSSDGPFKPLLDKGATMMRHDGTPKSGADVINYILGENITPIVRKRNALDDATPGTGLYHKMRALWKTHEEKMESLKSEIGKVLQNAQDRHHSWPDNTSNKEKVIAVMGSTGVGKSSFIRNSIPPGSRTEVKVGHSIQSETSEIQSISWVTENGIRVKIVDTPGFDDSRPGMNDVQVLKMIATFLINEYKGPRITGLIYVHRISDTRVGGSSQRNLRMFRKLCGDETMKNVVIVTTMWDRVTPEEGEKREQELATNERVFKPLLDNGAIMMRHYSTPESAADVIHHLLKKNPTTTQIVCEIVEEEKVLEATAAGTELRSDIQALLQKNNEEMKTLEVERRKMQRESTPKGKYTDQEGKRESAEERQKMHEAKAKLLIELYELKQGIAADFRAPDTKCIKGCSKLLQLVKKHCKSIAAKHPDVASCVSSCTQDFADAVAKSVEDLQSESSTLKSALASQDGYSNQQFMITNFHAKTHTLWTWTKARTDMEAVAQHIETILSSYRMPEVVASKVLNGDKAKRRKALNEILASVKDVVTDMRTMVDWWIQAIVEDTAPPKSGGAGFDDSAITGALTRVIRALDAYCEAYAKDTQDLRTQLKEFSSFSYTCS